MELLKNNSETYRFILTRHFKNQLKSYLKKDPGLKSRMLKEMEAKPIETYIFTFKAGTYLAPIVIFSKSERSDLKESEILGHLRATKIELGLS